MACRDVRFSDLPHTIVSEQKPNSITLASSELALNMFGASSELVRSRFEAEIWSIIQLASSELVRASRFAAKFHYASWFGAGSEPASVMEFRFFGFKS